MTGDEMERAIEFLLKNQATHDERISRTQAQLSETQAQLSETQAQLSETQAQLSQLGRVVRMQSESQSQLNEMLTRAVTGIADAQQRLTEAQTKTETKVDRLAGIVEVLVNRLSS